MADQTPPPNAPVPPAPVVPGKTWQDRYGPLLAALAFAVLSAALKWAGIDAPQPQTVAVMVAPELGPVHVTTSPASPEK